MCVGARLSGGLSQMKGDPTTNSLKKEKQHPPHPTLPFGYPAWAIFPPAPFQPPVRLMESEAEPPSERCEAAPLAAIAHPRAGMGFSSALGE